MMLTPKQKLFVKEYLVDLNATQAAIRSGYSEKTAKSIGQENLTKPDIANAIQIKMNKRAEKVEISAEYVLNAIKTTTDNAMADDDRTNVFKGAELLGKHLKLFTDKVDIGGQKDNPVLTKEADKSLIQQSLERLGAKKK